MAEGASEVQKGAQKHVGLEKKKTVAEQFLWADDESPRNPAQSSGKTETPGAPTEGEAA